MKRMDEMQRQSMTQRESCRWIDSKSPFVKISLPWGSETPLPLEQFYRPRQFDITAVHGIGSLFGHGHQILCAQVSSESIEEFIVSRIGIHARAGEGVHRRRH